MAKEKPTVRLRGGASLVKCCPTFSWDSKLVFCCSGDVVKIFSVNSGECVGNLRGHRSPVSCVKINPKNKLQVFSSSLDQTIIKWNYTDGVQLKTYQLHSPILTFWPLGTEDNTIVTLRKLSAGSELSLCKLDNSKYINHQSLIGRCSNDVRSVAMGMENEYMVSLQGKRMKVYSFKKKNTVDHMLERDKFTCVACHPTEYCIATGNTAGRIHLWWNFLSTKKVVRTECHWHALPVLHLTFTAEGSYLLSGGYECVLVKWQYNSHHRDFLPRLGAPIRFLACSSDNTLYITAHTDNVIQVISNSFTLMQVYQGLTRSHLEKAEIDPMPVGFLIDPRTKALVTNGKPGHLQFYCLHSDKQLYNLDIVCQNYISPETLSKPLTITDVRKAAFDDRGEWLVTLEMWDDGVMTPEIRLKFWHFNEKSQSFMLNTRVEMAHEKTVNTVAFRPSSAKRELSPMVVTTGDDGKFRLWTLVEDTDIYRTTTRWNCESVGFFRDLPAGRGCFSSDGSLLAVGFNSIITIWDPDTNGLKTTLHKHKNTDEPIGHMEFGLLRCSHLLVSTSKAQLSVWNLLTCAVQWSVSLEVVAMTRDLNSELIAVFTKHQDVFVFRPSNHAPVYTHGNVSHTQVISAVFLPHTKENSSKGDDVLPWGDKSQLYFMNKDQMLLTISSEKESDSTSDTTVSVAQNLPQPPMKMLMAESRKSGVQADTLSVFEGHSGQPGRQFITQMLSTPSHVLPPVTSLYEALLKSVLSTNKSMTNDDDEEERDTEMDQSNHDKSDSDSDMETDLTNETQANKTVSVSVREVGESTIHNSSDIQRLLNEETLLEGTKMEHGGFTVDNSSDMQRLLSEDNYNWLESVWK